MATATYKTLEVTQDGAVQTITLNRPKVLNAINRDMYTDVIKALKAAGEAPEVKVVIITGSGKYFSAGNDLRNFMQVDDFVTAAQEGRELLVQFVDAFIHFPKILIAAVNGPAIGIPVTTLALYDFVYAADTATFHTPFMQLAQSPEGCSSVLFPLIMGVGAASEFLIQGKKFTAAEAKECRLVTRVFPAAQLMGEVKQVATTIAGYAPQALVICKRLLSKNKAELLLRVNREEGDVLKERWVSEECMQAIMQFMSRRSRM